MFDIFYVFLVYFVVSKTAFVIRLRFIVTLGIYVVVMTFSIEGRI